VSSGYGNPQCPEEVTAYAALPGKQIDVDLRQKYVFGGK
jgi:hypothetical protein